MLRSFLLIITLLVTHHGVASPISDAWKFYIGSDINVYVTLHGEPVRNATVTRSITFRGSPAVDYAKTDGQGYFEMNAFYTHDFSALFYDGVSIKKKISINVDGKDYRIIYTIVDGIYNQEFSGRLPELHCELTDGSGIVRVKKHSLTALFTMCTYEGI